MDAIAGFGFGRFSLWARVVAVVWGIAVGELGAGAARSESPPVAASPVVRAMTAAELQALMRGEGYAVETDGDGDLVWKLDGFKALLCVNKNGSSIHFRAAFSDSAATWQKVNAWNRTKVYSRSYLDDENDPVLELDLDLEGGVTTARILDFLKTCRDSFGPWRSEVVN